METSVHRDTEKGISGVALQCQCCDSICVYTGDSNAIEHKEKNDGDSDHGILTESKNGSESSSKLHWSARDR